MNSEWAYARSWSCNEIVEFRGRYAIHKYCHVDQDSCDFHAHGPDLNHVVFDVAKEDAERVIEGLRQIIDRLQAT